MMGNEFFKFLVKMQQISLEDLQRCAKTSREQKVPLPHLLIQQRLFTKESLQQWIHLYQTSRDQTVMGQESGQVFLKTDAPFPTSEEDPSAQDTLALYEAPQPQIHSFFGKYKVLEKIAQGGMGIVYKVRHEALQQIYALKVIHFVEENKAEAVERFHQEARVCAKLKHPGIVQVFDSGEDHGMYYFCMEYVEGTTLEQKIQEGISIRDSAKILQQILDALHYAHTQKILHRDLKPANIFITQEGLPKIGDFGLAKELYQNSKNQTITKAGEILGTPAYMAPEQITGELHKTEATSDIYAIGICFYEMLTKERPFQGKSIHELFYRISTEDATPPSKRNNKIHPDLEAIVLKAIEKEKTKRYNTAKAFADDIGRFLDGFPVLAKHNTTATRAWKWMRRHRYQLALFLTIVFAFFFYFSTKQWLEYRKEQETFNNHRFNARQELKKEKTSLLFPLKRIEFLLHALNEINQALILKPHHQQTQQQKFEVGLQLIQLACQNKEYALAKFVARDLKSLKSISEESKKHLFQMIQETQKQQLKKHLERFDYWLQRMKEKTLDQWTREIALLEISKMPEKEIFERMHLLVEEGGQYFLQSHLREVSTEEFYKTVILAFGRTENPEAGPPLLNTLKKIMARRLEQKQPFSNSDLQYFVAIVQSLAFAKMEGCSAQIETIRLALGQHSFFWSETEAPLNRLLQLDQRSGSTSTTFSSAATSATEVQSLVRKSFDEYRIGKVKDALQTLNEATQKFPQEPTLYLNRGRIKEELSDLDGALADYTEAIRLSPQYALAYYNRGNIYANYKQYNQALENFQFARLYKPDFGNASLAIGEVYFNRKEFAKAEEECTRAIQAQSDLAQAYALRGKAKAALGKLSEGINDCQYALNLNPKNAKLWKMKGELFFEQKQPADALQALNQAVQLEPENYEWYSYRANIKEEMNDIEGAKQDFVQYLHLTQKYTHPNMLENHRKILQKYPSLKR